MLTLPSWLPLLSAWSLLLAGVSSALITADILRGYQQKMWIMNIVWPVTALWSGPLGLWAYIAVGRQSSKKVIQRAKALGRDPPAKQKPFWQSVEVGVTHCGAGCTLGDISAEWFVVAIPISVAGSVTFGTWALDFALAFLLGIGFQYFTIQPMRSLSFKDGLKAALKADTLSLTAWQIGMYGWMALTLFVFFTPEMMPKSQPTFWFMMQIAMIFGFLTSYPVNWWLLRKGWKETM
jgi:hypothetical protein